MLKLTKIEEILYDKLIKKDEEIVISISGEWGIGKTYFWKNTFLNKYKSELNNKKIAYVSLFGIDSLDDIRTVILLQSAPTKNKINWLNKKIMKPLQALKSLLKIDANVSMSFGLNSISSILSILTSGDFKNVIVCFDDFERMSSKINFKDVLGLISELKEQKLCKVIMILNEKELEKLSDIENKKYSEIFSLYKEKIIDINLKFEPIIEETLDNALKKVKTKFDRKILIGQFRNHDIKNIRVLQLVIKKLKEFEFIIDKKYNEKVLNEFLQTAISIFLFFIKDGKSIEDFFREKSKYDISKMSDEEFEEINFEERKESFFVNSDESIQTVILEYIDIDKINKINLQNILEDKNKHLNRYDTKDKISTLWYKLHVDFQYGIKDCAKELMDIFTESTNELHNILNIDDFHHYINFIKQNSVNVDPNTVDKIIKQYIDNFIIKEKSISIHEQYKQDFIKENYPHLLKYWNDEKQKKLIDETSIDNIEELLGKVLSGWGNKDEYILNNINADIYKKHILSSSTFTKSIVKFLSSKKDDKNHFVNAVTNIKKALKNLREEKEDYKFKVNKIVKETGITL